MLLFAFDKMIYNYKKNGFIMLMIIFVLFIIGFALYRMLKGDSVNEGTWTTDKYYNLIPVTTTMDKSVVHTAKSTRVNNTKGGKDSKGEVECRHVLSRIFNKPFLKDRPSFLNNPVTGGIFNLELDCYEKELGIACEYNGRQHYDFIPFFHKNKEAFFNQKYRDDMKRRLCKDEGVFLIEVPYTIDIGSIEDHIITKLKKHSLIK
uniref:DUF559 domain-containing protein n=1 Tax=viral metagenome TaxID=1070528 RepID=A0A6C0LSX9_9ZZZZ